MVNATLARLSRLTRDSLPVGDGPLIDAFLAGDQTAFTALVHRHAGLVFATCRRVLQHQQDAEDAFQATFLVLARRAGDIWPREAVSSWLFGVAHRVALKARAARARRAGREQRLEDEPGGEPPAHEFDRAEAVQRVVLKLPAAYRAAVVACDLEGLSRKDAAERLGWSEGTLSGRLARARALLADRLRGAGLSLPAAGIAVLATNERASAQVIQNTINVAIGVAGAAPAPVAALAEGVVRSMALFKLKAMAAVALVASALGFGAFAATGAGDGAGTATDPPASQPSRPKPVAPDAPPPAVPRAQPAPKGPRVDLAREELEVLLQEIEYAAIAGKVDKEALDNLRGRLQMADRLLIQNDPTREPKPPLTDRDRLQGAWRVTSITEGGTTKPTNPKDPWAIEVVSRTIRLPFREAEGQWKQHEYLFSVSPREQRPDSIEHPATIDLTAPNRALGKGIYEFTAPVETCVACHSASKGPKVQFGFVRDRIATVGCAPGLQSEGLGVRLALSTSGKRPTKFGGDGVLVLELQRAPKGDQKADERARLLDEARQKIDEQVELIEAKKKLEDALRAAIAADDKVKLEAELAILKKRVDELLARRGRREVESEFKRAELEYQKARAQMQASQAELDQATAKFQVASGKLAAAKKAFEEAHRPAPGRNDEVYTIHIRSLTAPEQVIRVKVTGSDTVLDSLELIPGAPIKPEGVSAWVVRGEKILPVDLVAITKHGVTGTNYQLNPGDQFFIQAKPSK